MSNDLIKRMDAIENVWSLFNNTYNDATRFNEEETDLTKRILSDVQAVIEKQLTTYDMDKVVERLKDKALEHAVNGQQYGEDGYDRLEDDEQAIKQGIEEAIEIVKSGGIE